MDENEFDLFLEKVSPFLTEKRSQFYSSSKRKYTRKFCYQIAVNFEVNRTYLVAVGHIYKPDKPVKKTIFRKRVYIAKETDLCFFTHLLDDCDSVLQQIALDMLELDYLFT